jgi:large subunit ribosomal protein L35
MDGHRKPRRLAKFRAGFVASGRSAADRRANARFRPRFDFGLWLSTVGLSAITPASRCPAIKGLPWRRYPLNPEHPLQNFQVLRALDRAGLSARGPDEESQMPKMKTKSGAKKRFKITGTGKVKYQQSGKRHGMIKRTTKTIREHRGTAVLFKTDGDTIKKYWLPNG